MERYVTTVWMDNDGWWTGEVRVRGELYGSFKRAILRDAMAACAVLILWMERRGPMVFNTPAEEGTMERYVTTVWMDDDGWWTGEVRVRGELYGSFTRAILRDVMAACAVLILSLERP